MFFSERLYFLLKSGIPLLDCLEIVAKQVSKPKKQKIYHEINKKISSGQRLSVACGNFFNKFEKSFIETGELSGFLSENLNYLSDHLKKQRDFKKKLVQAIVYPTFIAFSALGMILFLVFYIFPKILPVIKSMNVDLPLSTRFLIWLSDFAVSFFLTTLFVSFLSSFTFLFLFKKKERFRFSVEKFIFKIPIFSKFYKNFIFSIFCRNISFLLRGGLSFDQSLRVSRNSMSNLFFRSKINEMLGVVESGGQLSTFLSKDESIFPEDFASMVLIGEKSGSLEEIFSGLADYYESRFSEATKSLSQMIEPALMIVVGLSVGFIAISIISPIYGFTNGLQKI